MFWLQLMMQRMVTILSFRDRFVFLQLMNRIEPVLHEMLPTMMKTRQMVFAVCNPNVKEEMKTSKELMLYQIVI